MVGIHHNPNDSVLCPLGRPDEYFPHTGLATMNQLATRVDGASPYGVLNLVGNLWEWVDGLGRPSQHQLDGFLKEFNTFTPPVSADEPFAQIRGGSYKYPTLEFLSIDRWPQLTSDNGSSPVRVGRDDGGFRCVMAVKP
jgi:hypothetical protein